MFAQKKFKAIPHKENAVGRLLCDAALIIFYPFKSFAFNKQRQAVGLLSFSGRFLLPLNGYMAPAALEGAGVQWTPLRSRSTDRAGRRDSGDILCGYILLSYGIIQAFRGAFHNIPESSFSAISDGTYPLRNSALYDLSRRFPRFPCAWCRCIPFLFR